jgi:glyoxylase I family protein
MVKTAFSHVALVCPDPIAVERFYTKHFGFVRTRVYDPGPGQVVMLGKDGKYLEVFPAQEDLPTGPPTEAGPLYPCWRHISFIVDDLEAALAEIGADAPVTLGPAELSQHVEGMRVAWIADPAGKHRRTQPRLSR